MISLNLTRQRQVPPTSTRPSIREPRMCHVARWREHGGRRSEKNLGRYQVGTIISRYQGWDGWLTFFLTIFSRASLRIFPEIRLFCAYGQWVGRWTSPCFYGWWGYINLALDWYAHLRWHLRTYHVGKTIINHPFGIIWEWFIPLYGDLGDGLLLFEPH